MMLFEISAINLFLTGLFLLVLKGSVFVRPAVWVDSQVGLKSLRKIWECVVDG